MDEQPPTSSNNSQPSTGNNPELTELLLKARELELKQRELDFQERDAERKFQLEKRKAWLNSTLLIALVTTIIGGALVAIAQGYWNFRLEKQKSDSSFEFERQKFEFSLIQKSLEIEDKLIANPNHRQESANRLLFLKKSGIIQSLDSNEIEKLASNPNELPTFITSTPSDAKFYCAIINDIPTTMVIPRNRQGAIPFIKWTSGFFDAGIPREQLCTETANNFQKAAKNGPISLTASRQNRITVICSISKQNANCQQVLFTLKPNETPKGVLRRLHDFNSQVNSEPLEL